MPASHHAPIGDPHPMIAPSYSTRSHSYDVSSESAFSILQSVKEQEAQLEKLTRELEAERQDVANRLVRSEGSSGMLRASDPSQVDETYAWHLRDDDNDFGHSNGSHLPEPYRLTNRKVETTVNQKIERKEITARRVLPTDKGVNMPQYFPYSTQYYSGEPHVQNQESNYSVNVTYRPTSSPAPSSGTGPVGGNPNPANGYAVNPDNPSPNSSQLSVHSGEGGHPQLVSRTTTQNRTQQVTTVTKVIKSRELRHIGPDGQPLDYDPTLTYGSTQPPPPPPSDYTAYGYSGMTDPASRSDYGTYDSGRPPSPGAQEPPPGQDYMHYGTRPHSPGSEASSRRNYDSYPSPHRTSYQDYDPHMLPPPPPIGQARSPLPVDYAVYPMRQDGPPSGGYQGGYGSPGVGGNGMTGGGGGGSGGNYCDLADRPPTPPSPTSDASASPLPQRAMPQAGPGAQGQPPYPLSGYEELDNTLVLSRTPRNPDLYDPYGSHNPNHGGPYGIPAYLDHQKPNANTYGEHTPQPALYEDEEFPTDEQQPPADVRWRDPDLNEVVDFLQHPHSIVKANAAAYLQHLCYSDDDVKQKVKSLGGIPPLVALLNHEIPEVHRNACGALRNLSYGRKNDENKRAIKNASGIPSLIRLLRKTQDNEVRELVTGILWNMSSCEDLKKAIIDDGLTVITNSIIIPHSGWERNMDATEGHRNAEIYWSTVFRNASGVLRNVSSAGVYSRHKLRECEGLVDALLFLVKAAIGKSDIDNKSVENCVCVLRNLSYRCQEVDDPNYDAPTTNTPQTNRAGFPAGDNLGCFGGSKKKKEALNMEKQRKEVTGTSASPRPRSEPVVGMELLWQPEVVQSYLALLADCSNPETLEAAAGAIQNLAACYWQPSIDIRAAVRKEKGLPILVELLRMEVDRVVCAVATALRNLALDQRNKELIGKYAMKDLVQKLPLETQLHDTGTSDETYAAVLATLNEVIRKNAEFARSLLETGGIDRLMFITKQRGRFSVKVVKFASQVLYNLWQHQELRDPYKKQGWKESNFVTRTMAARSMSPNNANSTLNRPISSQGGTKYEDKTLQRSQEHNSAPPVAVRTPENTTYNRQPSEEVPLTDMPAYPAESTHRPPVGGVQVFPPGLVNREKKKLRQYDGHSYQGSANEVWEYERQQQHLLVDGHEEGQQGPGDSWV